MGSALLGALCLALLGCESVDQPTQNPEAAAPTQPRLSLADVADAIDPGTQPPLSASLPPWAFSVLGLPATPTISPAELLEFSRKEQAAFEARLEQGGNDASLVMALHGVARATVMAEQAAAAGTPDADTLARLERTYAAINVPQLMGNRSVFGQFIMLFAQMATSDGGDPNAFPIQEFAGLVQGSVQSAGALHLHTVAQLLRTAPDHEAVPTALLEVAETAELHHDMAVELVQLALERRGPDATDSERLDAARVCYRALDLACGDAALEAAKAGQPKADTLSNVEYHAELAHRIVALDGENEPSARIERARAELALGRHKTAEAAFEALRKELPNDARPVAGLAKHRIETEFDFAGAHAIIDGTDARENADVEYYELAIGTRAMAALADIAPLFVQGRGAEASRALRDVFARTRADLEGFAALGDDDAVYLRFVLDLGEAALTQFEKTGSVDVADLGQLAQRASKLHSTIPNNPHAYRLLMSLALFEPDKAQAVAAARVDPPDDALAIRRVRALCDLAISWNDPALAREAHEAAARLPSTDANALAVRADAALVAKQLANVGAWPQLGVYEQLIEEPVDTSDARAINNLAVVAWHLDKRDQAREFWTAASNLAEGHRDVARLNLLATAPDAGSASALAAVQALAAETETPGVGVVALAWARAWSKGKKAQKAADAALKAAVDEAAAKATAVAPPNPYAGVLLEGTLQAGLGYAVKTGLQIELDSQGVAWAILVPEQP